MGRNRKNKGAWLLDVSMTDMRVQNTFQQFMEDSRGIQMCPLIAFFGSSFDCLVVSNMLIFRPLKEQESNNGYIQILSGLKSINLLCPISYNFFSQADSRFPSGKGANVATLHVMVQFIFNCQASLSIINFLWRIDFLSYFIFVSYYVLLSSSRFFQLVIMLLIDKL